MEVTGWIEKCKELMHAPFATPPLPQWRRCRPRPLLMGDHTLDGCKLVYYRIHVRGQSNIAGSVLGENRHGKIEWQKNLESQSQSYYAPLLCSLSG